jgi:GxxExxY protein
METLHKELTDAIIGRFYHVYNKLGYGFSEKVYENALCIALRKVGLKAEKQNKIEVYYEDELVGDYKADIIVNDCVILELKAATLVVGEHEAQLMNYLKATKIEVGYILNFGPKPQFSRRIFTNDRK